MDLKTKISRGFTLIELVMVTLLLGILAAVAIPNFVDMQTEAKNAAVKGAIGGIRSAVSIARAAIALKEDSATQDYPTIIEMQANAFNGSHPQLSGKGIMDQSAGFPVNPWSLATIPIAQQNSVYNCSALSKGLVRSTAGEEDHGWCYAPSTGQSWANSDRNGDSTTTENQY